MTTEPLFKQLEVLGIKLKRDEFTSAWLKLALLYIVTSMIFVVILSYILYVALKGNLVTIVAMNYFDPFSQQIVLDNALQALKDRIVFADSLILIVIVFVGVVITYRTLLPIKKSMAAQKKFIADASHELRTPLSVLSLDIELAQRKKFTESEFQPFLLRIAKEVQHIVAMTSDLLLITKEVKNNTRVVSSLMGIIATISYESVHLGQEKGVEFVVDNNVQDLVELKISEVDTLRILRNVIKNAIQFSKSGSHVTLKVTKLNQTEIEFNITDSGIGISKEHLNKIFNPFFQVDPSHNQEGAGLGLSMVRSLVEKNSGTITIESTIGKGTVVTIILPSMRFTKTS